MELLRHFSTQRGLYVLIAIHDLGMAARFCDSISLVGEGGILLATGAPEAILSRDVFGVHAEINSTDTGAKLLDVSDTTLKTWGPHLETPP